MSALMKQNFYAQYGVSMTALILQETQLATAANTVPLVGPLVAAASLPGELETPDAVTAEEPMQVRVRCQSCMLRIGGCPEYCPAVVALAEALRCGCRTAFELGPLGFCRSVVVGQCVHGQSAESRNLNKCRR
jgi:hypothetical protein